MSATLQSRPTRSTPPHEPPKRPRRLVIAIAALGGLLLTAAVTVAVSRPGASVAPTSAAAGADADATAGQAMPLDGDTTSTTAGVQTSPAAPRDISELPPALRKRIEARQRPEANADTAEPKRGDRAPTTKRRGVVTPQQRAKADNPTREPQKGKAPKRAPEPQRGAPAGPAADSPNRLTASSHTTDGTKVRVTQAATALDRGFVTVHRFRDGRRGALLGVAEITQGVTDDLVVRLDSPITSPTDVVVSLHADTQEPGVYADGVDRPVVGPTGPVMQHITVTPR